MSKPVFWHLMFKAFSCNLANQVYFYYKRSPFKVSSGTSSHKLEMRQLHITALYYINCHAWACMAMLDVAVDVCHAESRRGTRELFACCTR